MSGADGAATCLVVLVRGEPEQVDMRLQYERVGRGRDYLDGGRVCSVAAAMIEG